MSPTLHPYTAHPGAASSSFSGSQHFSHASAHLVTSRGDVLLARASADHVQLLTATGETLELGQIESAVYVRDALKLAVGANEAPDHHAANACNSNVTCVALSQPDDASSEVLLAASFGGSVAVWSSTSPIDSSSSVRAWALHSLLPASPTPTCASSSSSHLKQSAQTVTALALHRSQLLIGTFSSTLHLFRLDGSSRIWSRIWSSSAPSSSTNDSTSSGKKPVATIDWMQDASHFAASLARDRRVCIWSAPAPPASLPSDLPSSSAQNSKSKIKAKPKLIDRIALPRSIVRLHWRRAPVYLGGDGAAYPSQGMDVDDFSGSSTHQQSGMISASQVLLVETSDNVFRIYAPLLDQPTRFRLWASIDAASFGSTDSSIATSGSSAPSSELGKTLYLDACDLTTAANGCVARMKQELQMIELGVGAVGGQTEGEKERIKDILRTRVRRLQHFMQDTPDMFMRVSAAPRIRRSSALGVQHSEQDSEAGGSLCIRAVANVDRRPPSLVQSYTALKMRHPFLAKCFSAAHGLADVREMRFEPFAPASAGGAGRIRGRGADEDEEEQDNMLEEHGKTANSSSTTRIPSSARLSIISADGTRTEAHLRIERLFDGDPRGCEPITAAQGYAQPRGHAGQIRLLCPAASGSSNSGAGFFSLASDAAHPATADARGTEIIHWPAAASSAQPIPPITVPGVTVRHVGLLSGANEQYIVAATSNALLLLDTARATQLAQLSLEKDERVLALCTGGALSNEEAAAHVVVAGSTGATLVALTLANGAGGDAQLSIVARYPLESTAGARAAAINWHEFTIVTHDGMTHFTLNAGIRTPKLVAALPLAPPTSLADAEQDAVLVSLSSTGRVALATPGSNTGIGGTLLIWDPRLQAFADGIEYRLDMILSSMDQAKSKSLTDLAWSPDGSVLAIASGQRVRLLAAARYDSSAAISDGWTCLAEVDCSAWARSVRAVVFDSSGQLCVTASNMLRIFSPMLVAPSGSGVGGAATLREAAARLNGPASPLCRPAFLRHAIRFGRFRLVHCALAQLAGALRGSTAMDDESLHLPDLPAAVIMQRESFAQDQRHRAEGQGSILDDDAGVNDDDGTGYHFTGDMLDVLETHLPTPRLTSQLSSSEQAEVKRLARIVRDADEQKAALDLNGMRYMIALRDGLHLRSAVESARETTTDEVRLPHGDLLWAYHSDRQELLAGFLDALHQGKISWVAARASGLFLWLRSPDLIATYAERVARSQYMTGEERDPVACSLLYFALGKQKLVLGLWKQAIWHPEQKKMLAFLKNDFTQERWKAAAMKNAYVLMGQRRFEFAATFFMLSGALKDTANICVRHLKDVQLAIALCKIGEGGEDGPILRELLAKTVVPMAFEAGDRWLLSWCLQVLRRGELIREAILAPFDQLAARPEITDLTGCSPERLRPDPQAGDRPDAALALLLAELKKQRNTLEDFKNTSRIEPDAERQFLLFTHRVLEKMGCHWLGLAMLRDWQFDQPRVPLIAQASAAETDDATEKTTVAHRSDTGVASWNSPRQMQNTSSALLAGEDEKAVAASDAPTVTTVKVMKEDNPSRLPSVCQLSEKESKKKEEKKKATANLMLQATKDNQQQASESFDLGSFGF